MGRGGLEILRDGSARRKAWRKEVPSTRKDRDPRAPFLAIMGRGCPTTPFPQGFILPFLDDYYEGHQNQRGSEGREEPERGLEIWAMALAVLVAVPISEKIGEDR